MLLYSLKNLSYLPLIAYIYIIIYRNVDTYVIEQLLIFDNVITNKRMVFHISNYFIELWSTYKELEK